MKYSDFLKYISCIDEINSLYYRFNNNKNIHNIHKSIDVGNGFLLKIDANSSELIISIHNNEQNTFYNFVKLRMNYPCPDSFKGYISCNSVKKYHHFNWYPSSYNNIKLFLNGYAEDIKLIDSGSLNNESDFNACYMQQSTLYSTDIIDMLFCISLCNISTEHEVVIYLELFEHVDQIMKLIKQIYWI